MVLSRAKHLNKTRGRRAARSEQAYTKSAKQAEWKFEWDAEQSSEGWRAELWPESRQAYEQTVQAGLQQHTWPSRHQCRQVDCVSFMLPSCHHTRCAKTYHTYVRWHGDPTQSEQDLVKDVSLISMQLGVRQALGAKCGRESRK